MAEIGVVLLLFTIGIEFPINQLLQIRKSVLLGGSFQVLLTTGATFLEARWFGLGAGLLQDFNGLFFPAGRQRHPAAELSLIAGRSKGVLSFRSGDGPGTTAKHPRPDPP
jgi:hypothetical protein